MKWACNVVVAGVVLTVILTSGSTREMDREQPTTALRLNVKSIPSGDELRPISYSFIFPNEMENPRFSYGSANNYLFIPSDDSGPLNLINLKTSNIERLERVGYSNVNFVKYSLVTSEEISVKDSGKIIYSDSKTICAKEKDPIQLRQGPTTFSFYCWSQKQHELLLTESTSLDDAKEFLLVYLSGQYPKESAKYLPAVQVASDLRRRLDLTECSIIHRRHRYTRSCVGEGKAQKCKDLNIDASISKLKCTVNEEGLEGLSLVATTLDTTSKAGVLFQEIYNHELLDKNLRDLKNLHIYKEDQLIVWYYDKTSISIFKQQGKTILSLNLGIEEHKNLSKEPQSFDHLLTEMKELAQDLTFSDIDVSKIETAGGGSGIFIGAGSFR